MFACPAADLCFFEYSVTGVKQAGRSLPRNEWVPIPVPRVIAGTPVHPVREVVLFLNEHARIVRAVSRHCGPVLSGLSFDPGRTPHAAMHPDCDGEVCDFVAAWAAAWQTRSSGRPVEWELRSPAADHVSRFRLQPASYARDALSGDSVQEYKDHSVLVIQDVTAVFSRHGSVPCDPARAGASRQLIRQDGLPAECPECGLVQSLDERIRALASQLIAAEETERRRIASDLHDSLGQTLSLLRFEIEGGRECARQKPGGEVCYPLDRAYRYIKHALAELREVIGNLQPAAFSALGLTGALEKLCSDFQAACPSVSLTMNLDDNGKNLDADLAITIYRVTQEALNNVAQHSNADHVALTLAVSQNEVNLAIEDDGIGIPPDSDIATGIGIASMKNRVERLRGTFSLARGTGTGCRVSARWRGASISSRR